MDRKKENSAAICLDAPSSMAPRMVTPDLEVPGIRRESEKHQSKRQSGNQVRNGINSCFSVFVSVFNNYERMPYSIRVMATVI